MKQLLVGSGGDRASSAYCTPGQYGTVWDNLGRSRTIQIQTIEAGAETGGCILTHAMETMEKKIDIAERGSRQM